MWQIPGRAIRTGYRVGRDTGLIQEGSAAYFAGLAAGLEDRERPPRSIPRYPRFQPHNKLSFAEAFESFREPARQILRETRSRLLGMSWIENLHPEDRDAFYGREIPRWARYQGYGYDFRPRFSGEGKRSVPRMPPPPDVQMLPAPPRRGRRFRGLDFRRVPRRYRPRRFGGYRVPSRYLPRFGGYS